ncbi:MAG: hypothetical protein B7Z73_05575 [Planctomycetia bacterium 21-64-5]|nr:MAG: hypothetical protein B7Z73_05575 [Planctomycetia bacterium 21-64-5]
MVNPVLFVGTVGEGVWRSSDGGVTWSRSSKGMFVECDVRALVVDLRPPSPIYAGTNEGVWRTLDGGDNWQRLDGPMNDLVTWSLLSDPRHAGSLLAGTRPARIFRSTDGGGAWRPCAAELAQECPGIVYNRVTTLRVDPLDRDRLWAGVEIDGVWTSRDRGATWHKLGRGLSSADIHGLAIVPGADGRRTLLATTNNDLNVSDDDGETWQPQRVGERFGHAYCRGLAQRPDRPEVLFLGNGDGPPGTVGAAWRSRDAGRSWERMTLPGTPNSTIWDFALSPSQPDDIYAYSVSGEVYHSPDGGDRWTKLPHEFGEIRAMVCMD